MIIEPHVVRMFDEYTTLAERIAKLQLFLGGAEVFNLPTEEVELLGEQLIAMAAYAQALGTRLSNYFNNMEYTL
jgi:hypothetical protein